ncbi:MAG: 23S rRNA (uracil(1939)-C(5))-methyltransferase RlmD [Alphaproteobacteria bacterium]|nr:23S rRNA (uracil(1939)-C(5))-methyltransferase RlmD [Alphaproteobacteria bacterium]
MKRSPPDRHPGPRRNRRPDGDVRERTPERWTPRGESLIPGPKRVLAWQGIPGETARFKLANAGRNQVLVRWVGAKDPHPHRVQPPCDRYDPCGGCPLMHLDAVGQADARTAMLQDTFAEAGLAPFPIDPLVTSPLQGFRHLIKLAAAPGDRGDLLLGAPGRYTRNVVPINRCLVVTPVLAEAMQALVKAAHEVRLRPWVGEGRGLLRWVIARQSAATGEVLVTVVAGHNPRVLQQYAEAATRRCDHIVGVHVHINDGPGNAIFSPDGQGLVGTTRLLGRDELRDRVGGVEVRIGPGDFFQTNPAIGDRIARDLVDLSGARDKAPVVDLYCGVGGFTLALAKASGWAFGVEVNAGAIQRAREAARAQGIPAEFAAGPALDLLPDLQRRLEGTRPSVVVDPARRGLEEGVLDAICALAPARLLYVSCNPRALARDLAALVERGWTVQRVRPYDMFPNTAHLELLAVVEPPGGAPEEPGRRGPRRKVVRG